jgi:hypothetical protein
MKTDMFTSFLVIFSQIHDELVVVCEILDPLELVRTSLHEFSNLGRVLYGALWLESICQIGEALG